MLAKATYRRTPLAVLVTLVSGAIGLIVGGVAAIAVRAMILSVSDFHEDNFLFMKIIPDFAHGMVAGWIAIAASGKILPWANYTVVSYIVIGAIIIAVLFVLLGQVVQRGIGYGIISDALRIIANGGGVWAGVLMSKARITGKQEKAASDAVAF